MAALSEDSSVPSAGRSTFREVQVAGWGTYLLSRRNIEGGGTMEGERIIAAWERYLERSNAAMGVELGDDESAWLEPEQLALSTSDLEIDHEALRNGMHNFAHRAIHDAAASVARGEASFCAIVADALRQAFFMGCFHEQMRAEEERRRDAEGAES